MQQWNSPEDMPAPSPQNLEQRLKNYYGPRLQEQPLPPETWYALSQQLNKRPARLRLKLPRLRLKPSRRRTFMLTDVREAFERVLIQSHISVPSAMLRCKLHKKLHEPFVHVSLFPRPTITLHLPTSFDTSATPAALDVLLATGLARYHSIYTPRTFLAGIFASVITLSSFIGAILLWLHNLPLLALPIAFAPILIILALIQPRRRNLYLTADVLTVQWLGRSRTCLGLHTLADRSHAPYRQRWGQPSLAERITRVCGTPVPANDERITITR